MQRLKKRLFREGVCIDVLGVLSTMFIYPGGKVLDGFWKTEENRLIEFVRLRRIIKV